MNYGPDATTYARHRWALPWKVESLLGAAGGLIGGANVLEVGCGTGDYLSALHDRHPERCYRGFDLSPEMLAQARARLPWATLVVADANREFPLRPESFDFVYVVDVLHHLQDYAHVFAECARVLKPAGHLMVITDSADDIRARSITECFPTTLAINLDRYPAIERLVASANSQGLELSSSKRIGGFLHLDDALMRALERKAMSELRLIPEAEHAQGMERVGEARRAGRAWRSQTTALEWSRREGGAPRPALRIG